MFLNPVSKGAVPAVFFKQRLNHVIRMYNHNKQKNTS